MSEAVRAFVTHVFQVNGARLTVGAALKENAASLRIPEKLGSVRDEEKADKRIAAGLAKATRLTGQRRPSGAQPGHGRVLIGPVNALRRVFPKPWGNGMKETTT
jgi:hypothetical protein